MSAIDVGDEMNVQHAAIRLKSLRHHVRAKIAAANANVNNIGDALTAVPDPGPTANALSKPYPITIIIDDPTL
jgi:hypothetical protein